MPIEIMSCHSLALLVRSSLGLDRRNVKAWIHIFALFPSLSLKYLEVKPPLPIITFDFVAFVFTLLKDNISRNSRMLLLFAPQVTRLLKKSGICMSSNKTTLSSSSLFPLQGEDLKKVVSSFGRANGLDARLRDALYHRLSSAMKGRAA